MKKSRKKLYTILRKIKRAKHLSWKWVGKHTNVRQAIITSVSLARALSRYTLHTRAYEQHVTLIIQDGLVMNPLKCNVLPDRWIQGNWELIHARRNHLFHLNWRYFTPVTSGRKRKAVYNITPSPFPSRTYPHRVAEHHIENDFQESIPIKPRTNNI